MADFSDCQCAFSREISSVIAASSALTLPIRSIEAASFSFFRASRSISRRVLPPLGPVDLGRLRVDLDPQARRGLVDEVDRLVGQEPVRDVAVRQRGGRDQRAVLDPDPVVDLVPLLQAAQDRDRVLQVGLGDQHRLEAALEGRVLLDVLLVLAERRRAHAAQVAPREGGLEQVGRVHRPLGGARADERVHLVDEEHDPSVGGLDLLQDRLEPVLELAPVLRARDQCPHVERQDRLVLQGLGHVAVGDAPREPLDDRRLADPGLADEDRVVLGAPRQDLDDPPDLVVAADHGVELPLARERGQVARELLEGLELVLGVRVGHALRPADVAQGGQDRVGRGPRGGEDPADVGFARAREREQEMLGRDVLVLELGGGPLRLPQGLGELRGGAQLRRPAPDRGDPVGGAPRGLEQERGVGAELAQGRRDDPLGLGEERDEQVKVPELGVPRLFGERLRLLESLLRLHGVTVGFHGHGFPPLL